MPELAPLKVRVEFDGSQLEEGAAEVETFSKAVETKMLPAGDAFVTFGEKGEVASVKISSATAKSRSDLDSLEARTREFAAGMDKDLSAGSQAFIKLGEEGAVSLEKLSVNIEGAGQDVEALGGDLLGIGPPGLAAAAAITAVAAAATIALLPVLAFGAGLVATLTLGVGAVGVFGLMGVAVVALAEHFNNWAEASANLTTATTTLTTAQDAHTKALRSLQEGEAAVANTRVLSQSQLLHLQDLQAAVVKTSNDLAAAQKGVAVATEAANNPFTILLADLNKMATTLGQQATPAAEALLGFIDTLIPDIQTFGSNMVTWFGDKLPVMLPIVRDLFDAIMEAIDRLALGLSPIFDEITKDPVGFEQAFSKSANDIVAAIVGLVQNFDNLRKWWEGDGQKLAAQVSFVMDFIGAAIQSMIFEIQLVIWLAQAMGLAFSLLGTALHDAALRIQDGFNIIAGAADAARRAVDGLAQRITSLPGVTGIISATETLAGGNLFGRAAGGAMVPNAIYDVGEDGPERVFMGQHGAVVVPGTPDGRRSGNTIHVHINGSGLNSDQVGKVVMATLRQHVLMYG